MNLWTKFKINWQVSSMDGYMKAVVDLLEEDRDAKLLDLGCSFGILARKIINKVKPKEVWGIDLDSEKIEGARKLGVSIVVSNLNYPIPLPIEEFDIVVASQIIEHLWNTDEFAREIFRVLKPTGKAIISTPNLAAWHNILYLILGKQPETVTVSDEMFPEKENPGHNRVFTKNELIKFLRFHRFKVDKIVGSGYLLGRPNIITVKVSKCPT